jgi:hypothetical protein
MKGIRKESIVGYLRYSSLPYLLGLRKPRKASVHIIDVLNKIQIEQFQNTAFV